jgi:translation initiation factor IF-1
LYSQRKKKKRRILIIAETIEIIGEVTECKPGAKFSVVLENGAIIEGHLSGKMRKNYIRILVGDRVKLEISPYDLTKGRIIYRYK